MEPRSIKPEDIEGYVQTEVFFTAGQAAEALGLPLGDEAELLTLCVITLKNGFTVTGESACADPAKFDAEVGRKIARANALNKVWPLMGYVLRSQLAGVSGLLESEDWKERVQDEAVQLEGKIKKLSAFFGTSEYKSLTEAQRRDLVEQAQYMKAYYQKLQDRLK